MPIARGKSGRFYGKSWYKTRTMFQNSGSFRLFRIAGVTVYLHSLWFVVAFYEISTHNRYSSIAWNIAEYLGLFLIVLLHEFGHALACRQVGGTADQILLWPLGGVAYSHLRHGPGPPFGVSALARS